MSDVGVNVEWDGYSWVGVVDGGGTTQAKNLDKLRKNVVEVVKLMRGDTISPDDVRLRVTVPGVVDAPQVDVVAALREVSARANELLGHLQIGLADSMKAAGFPLRDIGEVIGVSHQRVAQILAEHADYSFANAWLEVKSYMADRPAVEGDSDELHQLIAQVLGVGAVGAHLDKPRPETRPRSRKVKAGR